MNKMKFMMFTWPENPEEFGISAHCVPSYTPNDIGGYDYTGITPVIRVFKGRGVFCGADAHERFNALAVIMALWTGVEWLASFVGLNLEGMWQFIDIIISLVNLYFHFQLHIDVTTMVFGGEK